MKVTSIPIVFGALGTVSKGLVKGLETSEILGQAISIMLYNIEIIQNTVKCPEDSRRLAVTKTSVKYHQRTLIRKTLKD